MRQFEDQTQSVLAFRFLPNAWESIARPVHALPLDIFRVAAGSVLFIYFLRTFFEASLFSDPDGLIDHSLSLEVFWFTQIGLFRPGMTLWQFHAIFGSALLLCLFLIAGYRVRLSAAALYLIAVCTYRWNFLVMYVDDAIMHLLLFWLIVLPVGRTLTISEWMREGRPAWERWRSALVPGLTLRLFLVNLALLYLVAGLWKWTSPMWLDGTALYVVLKLPISYWQEFWGPHHIPFLKVFNYGTLVLEPLVPLMFILRKGHWMKYLLLICFLGLHGGTVATLDIPFANLACAASSVLIFREEIMDRIRGTTAVRNVPMTRSRIGLEGFAAASVVAALTLAMLSSVSLPTWRIPPRTEAGYAMQSMKVTNVGARAGTPGERDGFDEGWHEGLGPVQTVFFGFLWCAGIAQQYQLFNWIDHRNYTVSYRVRETAPDGSFREVGQDAVFDGSTRGVLLRFYIHGITWVRVPKSRQAELRESLLSRVKQRYCRTRQPEGEVTIDYLLERIDPQGGPSQNESGQLLRFRCN